MAPDIDDKMIDKMCVQLVGKSLRPYSVLDVWQYPIVVGYIEF